MRHECGIAKKRTDEFDIKDTCPSLEKLCESDVDAIAIFTQNWLHGPQAVQALKAGKHDYSAVPSAITMEEITDLINPVKPIFYSETGILAFSRD